MNYEERMDILKIIEDVKRPATNSKPHTDYDDGWEYACFLIKSRIVSLEASKSREKKEAHTKQIPKKPINENGIYYKCSECGWMLGSKDVSIFCESNYCPYCGQAIDWSV